MSEQGPGRRTVILHVGTPKSGTSYVQDVLFRNRETLAGHGIHYPVERFDDHFLAALDLMRLPWGGLEQQAIGAWDRLAATVRGLPGTTILSHEILATASRSQVGRALASLGHRPGDPTAPEVHVVLSARDLTRQVPAEWQENVKHRRSFTYAAFLRQIQDPERPTRVSSWFWGVQELPDILARWGAELPPEQVHVVTVPPSGGDPGELWRRFSHVLGLDGIDLDLTTDRSNPSLGAPETALVRRINRATNRHLPPADYRPLVRALLAHQTLSQRRDSPRLGLPPDVQTWVAGLEDAYADEIARRGYDVVGDLDDLRGARHAEGREWADPDHPRERQVSAAAVDAIGVLLLENARVGASEARLAEELAETREALERSYLRPTYKLREKVVRRLESGRVGRVAMRVYRVARGRSSRSA